jgi:hypothetical protein
VIVAVVGVIVVAAGIAWYAGEAHFRSCVAEAEAVTPVTERTQEATGPPPLPWEEPRVTEPQTYTHGLKARRLAVGECSRWPF